MRCAGCGAEVDGTARVRFTCPRAEPGDGIDHLLTPVPASSPQWPTTDEANPFLRYRTLMYPYRLALALGLTDESYCQLVSALDDAVAEIDGAGFRETPLTHVPELGPRVWVKNETQHVGGSHKARHLMGVMITLEVEDAARGAQQPRGRLAIASCGNAALAAAVIARAASRPIDVYIPEDAQESVVSRLEELGAALHVCSRTPGGQGDPCMVAFRQAVAQGSVPFSVQGPENGLVVEGGSTIGWEIIDQMAQVQRAPSELFIQVGGGALASGMCQALLAAHRWGRLSELPVVHTVQTSSAHPLKRAFDRVNELSQRTSLQEAMGYARTRRGGFMWPWESVPKSIAHGILDDETYDWAIPIEMMIATGGQALTVDEGSLSMAHRRGRETTGLDVCATGTAGLAGMMQRASESSVEGEQVLLFTGAER
jgi:threonine synthase